MKTRKTDDKAKTRDTQSEVIAKKSPSGKAAEQTAEYPRSHQYTSASGTPQAGGSRAESKLTGRTPNQSKSQQTIINEIVNVEGEQEPEAQNAGGGQSRVRANQQSNGPRGRGVSSVRGRDSGQVRGEEAGSSDKEQGISNRSSRQEVRRQQKVAPGRAKAKSPNTGQRRAS